MKTLLVVAISLVAAPLAAAEEADAVPSVGLVHLDERNVDTYYDYLAAVPVFRYRDEAGFTRAPLLTDAAYTSYAEGEGNRAASHLVVIGDAEGAKIAEACAVYRIPEDNVSAIEGDVVTVAGKLAVNWAAARDVVVAPYVPSGGKAAAASATYAAALASALNAPLLYTYTKRAPYETLSAFRHLGAKNVYLVDFGGKCPSGTVGKLTGEGRRLRGRFDRPGEIESFVETLLRSQRIKRLPREA